MDNADEHLWEWSIEQNMELYFNEDSIEIGTHGLEA